MQGDFKYDITWTTLAEYLRLLERRGVSPNVASFVGTATIREHVVGLDDRAADRGPARRDARPRAAARWRRAPSASARRSSTRRTRSTPPEELVELAKVAARYGGKYISHMRSEGDRLLEAVDEMIRVGREAGIPAEIYHLKAAGRGELAEARPRRSRRSRRRGGRA